MSWSTELWVASPDSVWGTVRESSRYGAPPCRRPTGPGCSPSGGRAEWQGAWPVRVSDRDSNWHLDLDWVRRRCWHRWSSNYDSDSNWNSDCRLMWQTWCRCPGPVVVAISVPAVAAPDPAPVVAAHWPPRCRHRWPDSRWRRRHKHRRRHLPPRGRIPESIPKRRKEAATAARASGPETRFSVSLSFRQMLRANSGPYLALPTPALGYFCFDIIYLTLYSFCRLHFTFAFGPMPKINAHSTHTSCLFHSHIYFWFLHFLDFWRAW